MRKQVEYDAYIDIVLYGRRSLCRSTGTVVATIKSTIKDLYMVNNRSGGAGPVEDETIQAEAV